MITIVITILLSNIVLTSSYRYIPFPKKFYRSSQLQAEKDNEWSADGFVNNEENLPKIEENVKEVLYNIFGELITSSAVNTVGYYMLEFRDEVSDWL